MPLIVITLLDHAAVTPVGKPVGVPIPVAPVVLWVIGVNAVLIHRVGLLDAADTVFEPDAAGWQQHLSDRKCIPTPIYIVYTVLVKCY